MPLCFNLALTYRYMIIKARCPSEQIDDAKQRGQFATQQAFAFGVVECVDASDVIDWYEHIATFYLPQTKTNKGLVTQKFENGKYY